MSSVGNQSLLEEKCNLANSSFENSPLLDKEKILRYSARSRDEFWDALSSNYDYLMDDGLIATCRVSISLYFYCTFAVINHDKDYSFAAKHVVTVSIV